MRQDVLAPFLDRQGVVVLDGGLATELEARGADLSDELWSARLLLDAPERIREVHLDYLRAGADCIVSASYQASFAGLAAQGLAAAEAERVLRRSVELARDARERWSAEKRDARRLPPLVAASVGPYGAFLADGSEFIGEYGVGEADLEAFHRRRLAVLAASGADLLACETIPSQREARVLARLLDETPDAAAWLSFSGREGGRIADGTPIAEVAAEIAGCRGLVALGVNCTAPRHLPELLAALAAGTDLPLVAYPNSGEGWDAGRRRWLPAERPPDAAEAVAWRRSGARLIGGCCRTGPAFVRALRRVLVDAGGGSPPPRIAG